MPLFYKNVAVISPESHGNRGLNRAVDFRFAVSANALPLGFSEIPFAACNYPVVFSSGSDAGLAAVVGLREKENLFADGDGSWRPGTYVPAYLRRYPFILLDARDQQQLTLAAEEDETRFPATGGEPLFEAGQPTDLTNQMLAFCAAYRNDCNSAGDFCRAMDAANLLVEKQADVTLGNDVPLHLTGFRVIDVDRFNALDDATFIEWRKRNWLPAIYAHLHSMMHWPLLVNLTIGRINAQR